MSMVLDFLIFFFGDDITSGYWVWLVQNYVCLYGVYSNYILTLLDELNKYSSHTTSPLYTVKTLVPLMIHLWHLMVKSIFTPLSHTYHDISTYYTNHVTKEKLILNNMKNQRCL